LFLLRKKLISDTKAAVAGPATYAVYRGIRALFSKCTKSCGVFALNTPKRQICMAKCKVIVLTKKLEAMKSGKVDQSKINDVLVKLEKAKAKLNSYQQYAHTTGRNPEPKVDVNKTRFFKVPK
jgi:hypothetical protein